METVRLNLSARPPKLVFHVKNQEEFLKAVSWSTVTWGGRFHEIYDISNSALTHDSKKSDYCVVFRDVPYGEGSTKPTISFDELIEKDYQSGTTLIPSYLDCLPAYHFAKEQALPSIKCEKSDDLLSAFRYGKLPDKDFFSVGYQEGYHNILQPTYTPSDPRVPPVKDNPHTPISLTGFFLEKERMGRRRSRPGVTIVWGNRSNFSHLSACWNLRAWEHRILFIDCENLLDSEKAAQDWLESIYPKIFGETESRLPSVGVVLPGLDIELARNFANKNNIAVYSDYETLREESNRGSDLFWRSQQESIIAFLDNRKLEFKNIYPNFLDFSVAHNERQRLGMEFELPTVFRSSENDYIHSIPDMDGKEECLLSSTSEYVRIHQNKIVRFEYLFSETTFVFLNSNMEFWERYFRQKALKIKRSPAGHTYTTQ